MIIFQLSSPGANDITTVFGLVMEKVESKGTINQTKPPKNVQEIKMHMGITVIMPEFRKQSHRSHIGCKTCCLLIYIYIVFICYFILKLLHERLSAKNPQYSISHSHLQEKLSLAISSKTVFERQHGSVQHRIKKIPQVFTECKHTETIQK